MSSTDHLDALELPPPHLGRELLRNTAVSVVLWDREIQATAANPVARSIFRTDFDAARDRSPEALLPDAAAQFVRTHVALTVESGLPSSNLVADVAGADAAQAHHRLFAFLPMRDDDGALGHVIALSLDVSGRRKLGTKTLEDLRLEAQRARAARAEYNRALADYTQLVRHRIANPLTSVLGGLQTLLELELDEPTRRALLTSMLESAKRIEQVSLRRSPISSEEAMLDAFPRSVD